MENSPANSTATTAMSMPTPIKGRGDGAHSVLSLGGFPALRQRDCAIQCQRLKSQKTTETTMLTSSEVASGM